MSSYQRKKQLSDEAVLAFKDQEIVRIQQKIESAIQRKRPNLRLLRGLSIGFGVLAIVVISLIMFQPYAIDPTYDLIQLSNTQYAILAKEDDFFFRYYYGAYVCQPGGITSQDEMFDLYAPYLFVDESEEMYLPQIRVYKYNKFTYFVEVRVLDEVKILEVQYFKRSLSTTAMELADLEIENFQADLQELSEWLDLYPPTINTTTNPVTFTPHGDVESLADSRTKRNYLRYVANHYQIENTYGEAEYLANPSTLTIIHQHIVTLNDDLQIQESHIDSQYLFTSQDVDMTPFLAYSFYDSMEFRSKSGPTDGIGFNVTEEDHGKDGVVSILDVTNRQYFSLILNYDDSTVQTARLVITFSDGQSVEFTPLVVHYNRALLIAPFRLSEEAIDLYGELGDVFQSIDIEYLNASEQVVCEVHWQP